MFRMFRNIIIFTLLKSIQAYEKYLAEGRCLHVQKQQMSICRCVHADVQDRCADVLNKLTVDGSHTKGQGLQT